MKAKHLKGIVGLFALGLAILSLVRLEQARADIDIERLRLGDTPATIYRGPETAGSLVLVSHGFAGSRQMMEAISLTLARGGHAVVAFDYLGHGRHRGVLSPEITTLTGTTEDLVQQTLDVADRARALTGLDRIALVGHSMATDVVVRAADRLDGVFGVAAISMYSDAVTEDHPNKLLIVSGAQETRLRAVALDAVAQLGDRVEDKTVIWGDRERRAVSAPWVGHVGVLWAPRTTTEIAAWLGDVVAPVRTGPWIGTLLLAVLILFWPLASVLPVAPSTPIPRLRRAVLAATVPVPFVAIVGLTGAPVLGLAGLGALALCLGVQGVLALAILRVSFAVQARDLAAALLLLFWGLAVFALALDRYGASFLPTDQRLTLMAVLLPATLLFAVADRVMVQGRNFLSRVLLRLPFLGAFLATMVLQPMGLGMVFTVVPVFVLFLLVYGTMAHWATARVGPWGPGFALGIILAWSIAASTPLFAVA